MPCCFKFFFVKEESMSYIFDRKDVLKAILSHDQVRRKIFRINVEDEKTSTVISHIVRVGDVVLTLIPFAKDKFVVCKNSL